MAILGIGDFETGNLNQWRSHQVGAGGILEATTGQVRQGTHAARFKVNPNDAAWNEATGRRSKLGNILADADRVGAHSPSIFYGFSLRLHPDFPNPFPKDPNNNQKWIFISEWHSASNTQMGPPLGLFMHVDGRLDIRQQLGGSAIDHPLIPAPMQRGVWHDFVFEVLWRCNTAGLLRVWHKLSTQASYGAAKINVTGIQTAQFYNNTCQKVYEMLGIYRGNNTGGTYEMWGDGYIIATTFEEVANHAHGTGASPNPTGMIPTTGWTVAEVTSQQTAMAPFGHAVQAFDGALNTAWVTQWSPSIAQRPHQLKIDMGQVHWVGTVHLANKGVINPPWNGWEMKGYNVWGSANNVDWGDVMAIGNLPNEAGWHNIPTTPKQVRWLWIYSITSYPNSAGNDEGSVLAEIGMSPTAPVVTFQLILNINPSTVVVSGGRVTQWNSTVGGISFTRHNPEGDPVPGPLWEPALNAVKGDGTGFLTTETPIITGGATRTIFLNCRRQSGDHDDMVLFILGDLWQGDGTFFQIDNALTVRTGNANAFFDVSLSTTEFQIVRIELHGNNLNSVKLFLNGTERTRTSSHSFILNTNSGPSGVLGRLHTNVPQVRSSSYIRAVRVYQGIPTAAQAATIEGELAAITSDVPVIQHIPNVTIIAAQTVNFNIVASSNTFPPEITIERALGVPQNLTLGTPQISGNQTTRSLTWINTHLPNPGNYTFTARATISGGVSATQNFTITINQDVPTVNAISNVTNTAGQTINFNIVSTGQATAPTISLTTQSGGTAPSGIVLGTEQINNFQTTRSFTWSTSNSIAGTYPLRAIGDIRGVTAQRDFTVTINQDVPTVNPISNVSTTAGQSIQFNIVASGQAAAPTITLTTQSGGTVPSGIVLGTPVISGNQTTRSFLWNTTNGDPGTYNLRAIGNIAGVTAQRDFTITIAQFVDTPTINPISNVTVNEGQTINFNIVASGQQSAPGITVERQDGSAAPPGIVLGQAVVSGTQTTRPFTWTTSNGNAGQYLLRGRATLPSASATANFTVTINQVISADPPVFTTSPPSLSVKPGDQVSFQTVATHADGWPTQTLTRNDGTTPPSGISFALSATSATSSTYQFSWTPQTEGNYALRITAEQSGKTTAATFTITVETPTAGPQAPPRIVTVPASTRFIEITGN